MGVKQCNREGCENILCSRYSSRYGYICYNCFEELVNSVLDTKVFMQTPKRYLASRYSRRLDLNKEFKFK